MENNLKQKFFDLIGQKAVADLQQMDLSILDEAIESLNNGNLAFENKTQELTEDGKLFLMVNFFILKKSMLLELLKAPALVFSESTGNMVYMGKIYPLGKRIDQ